jgi:hypothetical protein
LNEFVVILIAVRGEKKVFQGRKFPSCKCRAGHEGVILERYALASKSIARLWAR